MSIDQNRLDRCGHQHCHCSVRGAGFCGTYCGQEAAADQSPRSDCICGHPECRDPVEVIGGPISGRA
jgi:hypothetical protein